MTLAQQRASNPATSVWVSASAGTGKTKVLIDRLVAILYQGTPINHIVCLTFTKAAAVEMRERLLKRLQDDALKEHVSDGEAKAAAIYEALLESPETLKIMTLHAYCQSLLQKFPFEAGLPPFFDVLDDDKAQQLLMQALTHVLESPPTEAVAHAIEGVSNWMGEYVFENCLRDAFSRWHRVRHLERTYLDSAQYQKALINAFPAEIEETITPDIDTDALAELLLASTQAMDKTLGAALAAQGLASALFLTKDGSPRKKIVSADFKKKHPELGIDVDDLAHHLHQTQLRESYQNWLAANAHFWQIVQAVLAHFGTLKTEQGVLDYHDLILHSLALLSDDVTLAFVHQRLDYTIDHILVDESQDNSPEQWLFIHKLVDLFVRDDTPQRSFFVVGDVKQSIYGFQGAVPELFESLVYTFEHMLQSRGHRFERLTLDDSFRTVPEVLTIVDAVFAENPMGMGAYTHHNAYRCDAGWVGLTFLSKDDLKKTTATDDEENEPSTDWPIIDSYKPTTSKDAILAEHVADSIQRALNEGWVLPSVGRAIEARDVLILLRNRGALSGEIIRALKQRTIAVEGPDRIQLSTRQAIQDVMAVIRFLCLPQDDMALANILKSPFTNDGHGFDEETLFDVCHGREGSLWQSLCQNPSYAETASCLKGWLSRVDYESPSFLLRAILSPTYGAFENRLGADIHLLFETFLDTVMDLESNTPTLAEVLFQLERSMPVVKREGTAPIGVRIMTIHGSKGLEAPLVIVVDRDERLDLAKENLLWPKVDNPASGEIVELFCLKPKAGMAIESMHDLRENALDTMREERNRLLYVALTRPRDGLWVIGGGAWAIVVEQCLSGSMLNGKIPAFAQAVGTLAGNNTKEEIQLPSWIHQKYEQTKDIKKQDEKSEQTEAMKRGEVIHRLIETLTKTPADRWDIVITRFKEDGLSNVDVQKIHDLTRHPDFIFLFKADRAWSEVELLHEGKLLRIDRLIETNDAFLIIDFKTGEQRAIKAYKEQLAGYKTAIAPMVGAKPVRTYLFWTDALVLEEV
ncbi:MAG: UvrD-helicase domain-containing protein [Pseudomonadota bacterium]